jgi:hypothetical protein
VAVEASGRAQSLPKPKHLERVARYAASARDSFPPLLVTAAIDEDEFEHGLIAMLWGRRWRNGSGRWRPSSGARASCAPGLSGL